MLLLQESKDGEHIVYKLTYVRGFVFFLYLILFLILLNINATPVLFWVFFILLILICIDVFASNIIISGLIGFASFSPKMVWNKRFCEIRLIPRDKQRKEGL
jgi:uncharacterized integral membrane protein